MTKKNSDTIQDDESFDKFDTEKDPFNLKQDGSISTLGNNSDSWDIGSSSTPTAEPSKSLSSISPPSSSSSSSSSQEYEESISVDDDTLAEATELMKKRREMQRIATQYKCEIIGISNAIVGAFAGSLLGAAHGAVTNYQHFGKHGYGRVVLQASGSSAANFGFWLGVYSYSKCSLVGFRKKDDLLNTFGGAFMAGALVSVHSRSPAKILSSGLVSGMIMTLMESVNMK